MRSAVVAIVREAEAVTVGIRAIDVAVGIGVVAVVGDTVAVPVGVDARTGRNRRAGGEIGAEARLAAGVVQGRQREGNYYGARQG